MGSPNRYWLCAATGPTIKIWDLESKNMVEELKPEVPGSARADPPQCLSLAWSAGTATTLSECGRCLLPEAARPQRKTNRKLKLQTCQNSTKKQRGGKKKKKKKKKKK